MSIQTEIDRITAAVGAAYDAIEQKGGTVPQSETVAGLAEAIDSIPLQADHSLGLTSAAVGQIAKIAAVDADGKPTAWEAVDIPAGGGQNWELINHIKIADDAEETSALTISVDFSGNAFSLSRIRLIAYMPKYEGESDIPSFCFAKINNKMTGAPGQKTLAYTSLDLANKTSNTAWSWSEGCLTGNGAWECEYIISNPNIAVNWHTHNRFAEFSSPNAKRVKLVKLATNDYQAMYPITSVGFNSGLIFAGCEFWLYGTRI